MFISNKYIKQTSFILLHFGKVIYNLDSMIYNYGIGIPQCSENFCAADNFSKEVFPIQQQIHNFDEAVNRRGTDSKKYSDIYFPADVIPMWIADTDFKSPQPVVNALTHRAQHGVYGYTTESGRLKRAAKLWVGSRYKLDITEEQAEFCQGVIPGIISAVLALSHPGDKIILNTPCYPPFSQLVENNGRRILKNELLLQDGAYCFDFKDFEKKCSDPLTRIFILCNPHNPTCKVFTRDELAHIGEICMEHDVWIISDEIHGDIVFEGHCHVPIAGLSKDLADRSVTFINPSKTFNTAGFRTAAFIAANPHVKALVHNAIVRGKAFGENIFGTLAFCVAYEECAYYADGLVNYLQGSIDIIKEALRAIPGIELIEPQGTYLFWLDCRGLGLPQAELIKRFVDKAKVGVHSGLNFGEGFDGFIRMNIACPKSVLIRAFEQIKSEFS